jgi:16S rRNA (guanine(966)-N(2))-methyltransferase RsmD
MRVTGGRYKGRHLECPPGVIRPAMDKMREALFSILGSVEGHSFLDLFSGSGAVGIDAASRGAWPVVLVERDRGKRPVILKNLALVESEILLRTMPVERYVQRATEPFDLIYCDPPYAYKHKSDLLARIGASPLCAAHTIVAMHHSAKEELPDRSGALELAESRRYGNARLSFLRHPG